MEKDEIWNQTLALLLKDVEEDDPKTVFLHMLSPLDIFGDHFVLLAENAAVETWVRNNYLDEIQEVIRNISDQPLVVGLGVNNAQKDTTQQPEQTKPSQEQNPQTIPFPNPISSGTSQSEEPDWLNQFVDPASLSNQATSGPNKEAEKVSPLGNQYVESPTRGYEALFSKCTFDTFVVGDSNSFARGAALAVAEQPGIAYNPLFIYGNSGLGKTHLLVSIANYVMQNYPRMTTQYVSANDFLNDYVEATQKNQWASFNHKYRQADVLLVDDVQYLEGKDETINQFFNIFNEMKNSNRQIVLSADRAPKDINMDDRITTRLNSGVPAEINQPDYETRLAIIKNYLSRVNQNTSFFGNIPDDVLSYIAEIAKSNIREMEGAVNRIVSNMAVMKKETISVGEAQELLQNFFASAEDKKINIELIQSEVERFFNITHEDMISGKRSKGITTPRHIAIYLSRSLTEESLEAIGKKFGNRDHTTIMYSVAKIERELNENRNLFDQIDNLMTRLKK